MISGLDRKRYADNYTVMAQHQLELGRHGQALASLRRALQLLPNHQPSLLAIGRLLYHQGQAEQAAPYLQRLVSIDGDDHEARVLLGNVCLGEQRFAEAVEHYEAASVLGAESADLCYNWGLAHYFLEDMAAAERCFRQALEIEPAFARALDGLGCLARYRGQLEAAAALFRQALAADSALADPIEHLAQVYLDMSRPDRSLATLLEALDQHPKSARLWYLAANAASDLRDHDRAVELLERAVDLPECPIEAHVLLAAELRELGQAQAAVAAADRAVELDDTSAEAHLERGRALAAAGCQADAIQALLAAWRLAPEDGTIAAALASLRRRPGG